MCPNSPTWAAPHIGHLYTALLADAGHRWSKMMGATPSVLSTGTDEHGLKIQKVSFRECACAPEAICSTCFLQAADAVNMSPLQLCNQVSTEFKVSLIDTIQTCTCFIVGIIIYSLFFVGVCVILVYIYIQCLLLVLFFVGVCVILVCSVCLTELVWIIPTMLELLRQGTFKLYTTSGSVYIYFQFHFLSLCIYPE